MKNNRVNADPSCDLCGLPVRGEGKATHGEDAGLRFCCAGCRMVYHMLAEAADAPDPSRFKETELYRRCVAAGVVPADEADLAARHSAWDRESDAALEPEPFDIPETLPLQIRVHGMWCPACAWVIQSALERIQGVGDVVCDFATDRLRCRYDPTRTAPRTILDAVENLGYTPLPAAAEEKDRTRQKEFVRWVVSALLSVNVMMLSWALYSGFFTSLSITDIRYISWPILILATLVMAFGGGPLFRKAWWGVRSGAPGMEALVCLGAGSAYVYSLFNFMMGSWHLYFDTASMLITLVLLGKLLEAKAKTDVRRDLESFLALQPNKVRMVTARFPQGRFTALEQLAPGDRFRVMADEMVPADGRVVSGRGVVDTSAVTGESRPLTLGPGDAVTSGTSLVQGDVVVETVRVGSEALLGQMIGIIEQGLARRTPLESRTDRWLAFFVPLVVGLSAITGIVGWVWGLSGEEAFVRALTVMVIACPCALGIAIPLARIAGIARAGRSGILVRDFEAFERATRVDEVVFDKTGTLTHGRWIVEKIETRGEMTREQALALAAGLEEGVDHTIARVIDAYVREHGLSAARVTGVRIDAQGVQGDFQGHCLRIGSLDYALPSQKARSLQNPEDSNALLSKVYLSRDGEVAAVFYFGDTLRKDSPALIQNLKDAGYQIHLVSGDSGQVTRAVARSIGVAGARGDMLPQDKAAMVAGRQAMGRRAAMVGDGINDAPALAVADLSVAVHRDASLSQQAAVVTLMRGDPGQLPDFFRLSRQVNAKVIQNLTCAVVYNLVGIPIAMSGLLNPLISATAMLLSSLTVIGNTLLLVHKK